MLALCSLSVAIALLLILIATTATLWVILAGFVLLCIQGSLGAEQELDTIAVQMLSAKA